MDTPMKASVANEDIHNTPFTSVTVYRGVPLDPKFEHTLMPANQDVGNALEQYAVMRFTNMTYQRVELGTIRLEARYEDIFDCNYIRIRNAWHEGHQGNTNYRTWYAFIDTVDYVSEWAVQVNYTVDPMITFINDYTVDPCFVEREHPITDEPGENTVPENLETGDYIDSDVEYIEELDLTSASNRRYIVAATFKRNPDLNAPTDEWLEDASGSTIGTVYSGLYLNVFSNATDIDNMMKGVNDFNGHILEAYGYDFAKLEGIASIYMVPALAADTIKTSVTNSTNTKSYTFQYPHTREQSFRERGKLSTDRYKPHNNKLYTYPYTCLFVSNMQGVGNAFKFENFDNPDVPIFQYMFNGSPNPECILYPTSYSGQGSNKDEAIVLTGWPECPYVTDTYKSWMALEKSRMVAGTVNLIAAGAASYGSAKAYEATAELQEGAFAGTIARAKSGVKAAKYGIAANLVSGIANELASMHQHALMPDQAHGRSANYAMCDAGMINYMFCVRSITAEFAQIIDNYFDRFGYATHRVKTPNMTSRPHWNFVKTMGCHIRSDSIPSEYVRQIEQIFDNGITFWKDINEVGTYAYDNSPTA